jgi:hypothetical protein
MSATKLFDIKALEADVDKEMFEEHLKDAKKKLITKRKEIASAERIVRNLRREYDVLVLEISDDA